MFADPKELVRKRSIDDVIKELLEVRKKMPSINQITFDDDAFMLYSTQQIKEFSEKYKKYIGLPLEIGGATPKTLTREKLLPLIDGGLTSVRMGIESGAERTKKAYKRKYTNATVEKAANLLHEFREEIPLPRYDMIINNPLENDEEVVETLMFLTKIPVPYEMNLFSLSFYPGTELYDIAKQEGIINDDLNDVYRKSYNLFADGTSGKLLNEPYLSNLFYLLYVYAKNGRSISSKQMRSLVSRKSNPVKSRLLYFVMKNKASYFLKKETVTQLWANSMNGYRQKAENKHPGSGITVSERSVKSSGPVGYRSD